MSQPCSWCGVVACEARFHELLAHDFSDPGYGAVHHLVVGSYQFQHGFVESSGLEAMLGFMRELMWRFPGDRDRARVWAAADGATRVVRRERQPPESPPAWAMTVRDVDDSSPEAYRRTVRAWAASILDTLGQVSSRSGVNPSRSR